MTWNCIPYTSSPVREGASLPTHSSDTDLSELSKEPLSKESFEAWLGQDGWWDSEQGIPRTTRVTKHRASRLRSLGNGQVPACAALAWRILTP